MVTVAFLWAERRLKLLSQEDRAPFWTGRLPWVWGELMPGIEVPDGEAEDLRIATRSVASSTSTDRLFLWLCQLRRAPYSYDWLDNFGRRSPSEADPALCELEMGQRVMTIFTLIDFEPAESITLRMNRGWPRRTFGDLRLQYRAERMGEQSSRLSVVMWMPPIGRLFSRQRRYLLAWGDLIMMRKQLLVLRNLAENDAA